MPISLNHHDLAFRLGKFQTPKTSKSAKRISLVLGTDEEVKKVFNLSPRPRMQHLVPPGAGSGHPPAVFSPPDPDGIEEGSC